MIKKDCEYWEAQEQNECYMFKSFDCSKCLKYKSINKINIGCIGHVGYGKATIAEVLKKYINKK